MRDIGSGNIGATNVLRTGRKDIAAATLLLDGLKGTAAVLIFAQFSPLAGVVAGFAAFLGHIFPVWLKFKGGKGVATFLGCLFGFAWPAGLAFCAIWLLVAKLSRYSSLSALVASAVSPLDSAGARPARAGAGAGRHGGDPVDQTFGKHRPPARRNGRPHRPEDMNAPLSTEQKLDWLQLIRCDNIGPRTFRSLLNRYGGAAQAWPRCRN